MQVPSLSNTRLSKTEIVLLGIGVLLLLVLASASTGFALMILCGILWAQFAWLAPIGFWSAWGITVMTSALLGAGGGAWRASVR